MHLLTKIYLKKGREDSLKRFHPWVFSGAIRKIEGSPLEGDVVEVLSDKGEFLAFGHYQVGSITVRILAFDRNFIPIEESSSGSSLIGFGEGFWLDRVSRAKRMREALLLPAPKTDAYRLIHGEGDLLPGLVVDIYGHVAVIQAHSAGMYLSLPSITEALVTAYGPNLQAVYNKSEGTAPFKAGLELRDGFLYSSSEFNPSEPVVVLENGKKFLVDLIGGQKTGFFLDQRSNRALVERYSSGKNVLNLFCYTGGFSLYALSGGAKRVLSVDSSQPAINILEKNLSLNDFSKSSHESVCGDAIDYLKNIPKGEFDLIVVDPPAFAKHRGALDNALRAYRRLNANAIEKVSSGGLVFTFSCSQVVSREAFALSVFSAAAQTGRNVSILEILTQPADHPVNIYHPEGEYLKGLLIYVD